MASQREKSFDVFVKEKSNPGMLKNLVMRVSKSIGKLGGPREIDDEDNLKDFKKFIEEEIFPLQEEYLHHISGEDYANTVTGIFYQQEQSFEADLNLDLREKLGWVETVKRSPALALPTSNTERKGLLDQFLCNYEAGAALRSRDIQHKQDIFQNSGSGQTVNGAENELVAAFTRMYMDSIDKRMVKQKYLQFEALNGIYEKEIEFELKEIQDVREALKSQQFNLQKQFEIKGKLKMEMEHSNLLLDAIENDDTGLIEITELEERQLTEYRHQIYHIIMIMIMISNLS